jgi:hypothetical protein
MVEDCRGVGSVGEFDVLGLRTSEPTRVVADHAVALGKRAHLAVPHAQAAEPAVDQQQRRAVALDLEVDPAAVDVDKPSLTHVRPSRA